MPSLCPSGARSATGWEARGGETMEQAWPPTGQYLHISPTAQGRAHLGETSEKTGKRNRTTDGMDTALSGCSSLCRPLGCRPLAGGRAPRWPVSLVTRLSERETGLRGATPGVSVRTHLCREKTDQMSPGSPQPTSASSAPGGNSAPLAAGAAVSPTIGRRTWLAGQDGQRQS